MGRNFVPSFTCFSPLLQFLGIAKVIRMYTPVPDPSWLIVAPFVIIAAGVAAICCIVVNRNRVRPGNEGEEKKAEKGAMIRVEA